MTTSNIRKIAKARSFNIFHLEDDDDWLEIIQDNVLEKFGLRFKYEHHQCKSIEELEEKFNNHPSLAIIIVDLRLTPDVEDVQGLGWLLQKIMALRSKHVEVFVLSAYLSGPLYHSNRSLLNYNDLSNDHLHDKSTFDEDRFLVMLEAAALRLLELITRPLDKAPKGSLFGLDAFIANVNTLNGIYLVQEKRPYFIDVEITSLKNLSFLTKKFLQVYVYSLEANVSPKVAELIIPKEPYAFNCVRFEISFNLLDAPSVRDLFVAVFLGNNLLHLLEMRIGIEQASSNNLDNIPTSVTYGVHA